MLEEFVRDCSRHGCRHPFLAVSFVIMEAALVLFPVTVDGLRQPCRKHWATARMYNMARLPPSIQIGHITKSFLCSLSRGWWSAIWTDCGNRAGSSHHQLFHKLRTVADIYSTAESHIVIVCIVIQLELDMDGLRQPCRRLAQLCVFGKDNHS